MISRYSVTLNGISLESLHPKILLLDVLYPPVEYQRETIGSIKRDGSRVHRAHKEKAEVTIQFAIRAYNIAERQQICQSVCKWARNGGRLQINDRPGQFLDCVCDSLPSITSARGWTDTLEVRFAAYAIPFWQDVSQTVVELSGPNPTGYEYVNGNASWTFVEAIIVPKATLTFITFDINDLGLYNLFYLNGLNVAANSTINITYDQNALLSITQGNTSLLGNHSGKDDLIAVCGQINSFTYDANANCNVTLKFRGYWE